MKSIITRWFVLFALSGSLCLAQTGTFTFPFDSNDMWEYDVCSNFEGYPIDHVRMWLGADTLMPNGVFYKPFCEPSRTLCYFRSQGSQVFQYLPDDSLEFVRYDFSKKPGDTVGVLPPDQSLIILIGDQITELYGGERRQLSFQSSSGFVLDNVVDGVGISYFNPGGTDIMYQLTGAKIGDSTYGVINAVGNNTAPVPLTPQLAQNFPNPFNPTTTIAFTLPVRSRVRIAVVDLLGRSVAELANGEFNSGSHDVIWNARAASGVYFCRMESVPMDQPGRSFVDVKKMVVTK